ncbi:hypothetical protein JYU34_015575 [Plutella xylostella]|uniref:Uncharacterized protein n=1 Tax=Plutella xylostella TaxID=51655 RepID=A0ABQ7Q483_PLUXY|nr:hypothetical protein JYU34_015575 [Plutella xylostella]
MRQTWPAQFHLSFAVSTPTSTMRVWERSMVFLTRCVNFTPRRLRSIALWQTFSLVF